MSEISDRFIIQKGSLFLTGCFFHYKRVSFIYAFLMQGNGKLIHTGNVSIRRSPKKEE